MKIKPEKKNHIIKAYISKTYKSYLESQCKKREIKISELIRISLAEFFHPRFERIIRHDIPIVRIDRTPKGSQIPEDKAKMNDVVREFKAINIKTILKPTPKDKMRHIYNIMTHK